jgi:hypothetical protein
MGRLKIGVGLHPQHAAFADDARAWRRADGRRQPDGGRTRCGRCSRSEPRGGSVGGERRRRPNETKTGDDAGDPAVGAGVAALLDLMPQRPGVAEAPAPPLHEVALVRRQSHRTRSTPLGPLGL